MKPKKSPQLRTVSKVEAPYPLGKFPKDFAFKVGRPIIYLVATSPIPRIEGKDWEKIFADAIDAEWKPSNVGLDDIRLGICAWGAKTVYHTNPYNTETVRLISGRNSPTYSYNQTDLGIKADEIGAQVLEIWNGRVESLRNTFSNLRTVVLIKSKDLTKFTVFETDTVLYPVDRYKWERNKKGNLEGREIATNFHKFTWQPSGSQFTIIEAVPSKKLSFRIKKPKRINEDQVLKDIGFDKSWIEVVK